MQEVGCPDPAAVVDIMESRLSRRAFSLTAPIVAEEGPAGEAMLMRFDSLGGSTADAASYIVHSKSASRFRDAIPAHVCIVNTKLLEFQYSSDIGRVQQAIGDLEIELGRAKAGHRKLLNLKRLEFGSFDNGAADYESSDRECTDGKRTHGYRADRSRYRGHASKTPRL